MVFSRMVAMFMLPTFIINPARVFGLYAEAQAYRALVASVTGPVTPAVTSYEYDNNGNTTTKTADGNTVSRYFYDGYNRLAAVVDPRGKEMAYR